MLELGLAILGAFILQSIFSAVQMKHFPRSLSVSGVGAEWPVDVRPEVSEQEL